MWLQSILVRCHAKLGHFEVLVTSYQNIGSGWYSQAQLPLSSDGGGWCSLPTLDGGKSLAIIILIISYIIKLGHTLIVFIMTIIFKLIFF